MKKLSNDLNVKKLKPKDKFLLLKGIIAISNDAYTKHNAFIINQLLKKNEKYTSKYDLGSFSVRHDETEKTVAELISEKQNKIKTLELEIEELKDKNPNEVIKTDKYCLMSKITDYNKQVGKKLLKDLFNELDNAQMLKELND